MGLSITVEVPLLRLDIRWRPLGCCPPFVVSEYEVLHDCLINAVVDSLEKTVVPFLFKNPDVVSENGAKMIISAPVLTQLFRL